MLLILALLCSRLIGLQTHVQVLGADDYESLTRTLTPFLCEDGLWRELCQ